MLDYKLSPKVERYFKKIKNNELKRRYHEAIIAIRTDPYKGSQKKGSLRGIYGYDIYYNNINYEIAYEIVERDGELIIIILAGTRENFYDELNSYIKKHRRNYPK